MRRRMTRKARRRQLSWQSAAARRGGITPWVTWGALIAGASSTPLCDRGTAAFQPGRCAAGQGGHLRCGWTAVTRVAVAREHGISGYVVGTQNSVINNQLILTPPFSAS